MIFCRAGIPPPLQPGPMGGPPVPGPQMRFPHGPPFEDHPRHLKEPGNEPAMYVLMVCLGQGLFCHEFF